MKQPPHDNPIVRNFLNCTFAPHITTTTIIAGLRLVLTASSRGCAGTRTTTRLLFSSRLHHYRMMATSSSPMKKKGKVEEQDEVRTTTINEQHQQLPSVEEILALTMQASRREMLGLEKKVSTQDMVRTQIRTRAAMLGMKDLDHVLPKIVHVAGTKGKGSTCAMLESILRHGGLKTGLFTSPHLIDPRERIRINGKLISKDAFQKHVSETFAGLTAATTTEPDSLPGFFPFMTLCAFRTFAQTTPLREQVDVLILETGIGGRLDATNVLDSPLCTAVTKLDLDHTQLLGNTIEEIAYEKACISKPGVPCFTPTSQTPGALAVLIKTAQERGTTLTQCPPISAMPAMGLAGEHQLENAAIAKALALVVFQHFNIVDKTKIQSAIQDGLQNVSWPGRSQIVRGKDGITYYFDGAHTPISVESAYKWFLSALPSPATAKCVLVFHCSEDRDGIKMLSKLNPSQFEAALFCPPSSGPPPSAAASVTATGMGGEGKVTWHEVLATAWNQMSGGGVGKTNAQGRALGKFDELQPALQSLQNHHDSSLHVFVVGSFYLVGDMLKGLGYEIQ